MKPTLIALVLAALCASPAAAQQRRLPPPPPPPDQPYLRPFFLVTGEAFTAGQTFDAIFGQRFQPFFGGGLQFGMRNGVFIEAAASRFSKTGQRAFIGPTGQVFQVGVPLTATVTPFEVTAGYRFRHRRTVVPYVGAGIGTYAYSESSPRSDTGEDVNARHTGFLVTGGVEFRASRWVRVSGDVQYTHVPGILGAGGVSQQANETDLGGTAARFKVLVGR